MYHEIENYIMLNIPYTNNAVRFLHSASRKDWINPLDVVYLYYNVTDKSECKHIHILCTVM